MSNNRTLIDESKLNRFADRVLEDLSGTYTALMCVIGDRLNLFKALESHGPATSMELSNNLDLNERYIREWLAMMGSAGYLEYDPKTQRFTLPPEHAAALTQEGGPVFVGGMYQCLLADVKNMERLINVFADGGGIPLEDFDKDEFDGTKRLTDTWFENLLLQEWIPAVPDVKAKLEQGALVADVGCGRGKATIKLAQAFPNSRFIGYDIFRPSIDIAASEAISNGVSERVSFTQLDIADGFPSDELQKYDLITTFDVIHDMVNPRAALRSIRQALKSDGTYLWLEINSKENLEDNFGTMGTLLYGMSIVYCMTTSLAGGGEGLGTVGMPQSKVIEYCKEAGFHSVRKLPVDNPFNVLYEIKF